MYVADTGFFYALRHIYRANFPSVWQHIDQLVAAGQLLSVREVRNELEWHAPSEAVLDWTKAVRHIFTTPSAEELRTVGEILATPAFTGLVRIENIIRGRPVADPFVVAAAVHRRQAVVITEENLLKDGARVPAVCRAYKIQCDNFEGFLKREKIRV